MQMIEHVKGDSNCVIMLGYTPNNAVSIGTVLDFFPGYKAFCFLSCKRDLVEYDERVTWLSLNSDNIILKAFSFFKTSIQLKYILMRYKHVAVCLSHPDHLIGNYLFFHKKVAQRYIYEDGLLNYYDAIRSDALEKKARWREKFGWLVGLNCRYYEGLISGVDARRYDGAFLSVPEKAAKAERLGDIVHVSRYSRGKGDYTASNAILFLDQNIETLVSSGVAASLRSAMKDFLAGEEGEVIVKRHYDMVDSPCHSDGPLVSVADSKLPAEQLIEKLKPCAVVSFMSSALMNIKLLYPEIRSVAVGANQFPLLINGETAHAGDLLEIFGVESVMVDVLRS